MADPAVVAALILEHAEAMVIGSPSLPIAYPDVTFVPPADGKYLRVDLFTNEPFWQGLSNGRIDQGLTQVMVAWPRSEGRIRPLEVAAMVMEHWARLTVLQGSGVRVRINKEPWASSPIPSDRMTETPITIPWVAV